MYIRVKLRCKLRYNMIESFGSLNRGFFFGGYFQNKRLKKRCWFCRMSVQNEYEVCWNVKLEKLKFLILKV